MALLRSADTKIPDGICIKRISLLALRAWNDAPALLRELPALNSFKKQPKASLKSYRQQHTE